MKLTFGQLLQTTKDFCVDDKTSSTTGLTNTELFLKREINKTVQFTHNALKKAYKTKELPKTMSSVVDQQYYYYPPGLNRIDTVTIDNDTSIPPLRVIQNQREWDRLNSYPQTSGIPTHIFMRARDFGIYPIPGDVYTLTLTGRFYPRPMSADDYILGSVTVNQNSQTITGTSGGFTSSMVGRYFSETDSNKETIGNLYRVGAFTSTTVLTLDTFFEEAALSDSSYVIGESPEIPDELHELIPYRVAGIYYGTRRRDSKKGQEYLNYFYTGDFGNPMRKGQFDAGLLGFIQDYALNGSDNTQILDLNEPVRHHYLSEEWETVTL